jgi:hypothetical protein
MMQSVFFSVFAHVYHEFCALEHFWLHTNTTAVITHAGSSKHVTSLTSEVRLLSVHEGYPQRKAST